MAARAKSFSLDLGGGRLIRLPQPTRPPIEVAGLPDQPLEEPVAEPPPRAIAAPDPDLIQMERREALAATPTELFVLEPPATAPDAPQPDPDSTAGSGGLIPEPDATRAAAEIELLRTALKEAQLAGSPGGGEPAGSQSDELEHELVAAVADATLTGTAAVELLTAQLEQAAATADELREANRELTEKLEQQDVHASGLADVVRAETKRREDAAEELAEIREQLASARRELESHRGIGRDAQQAMQAQVDGRRRAETKAKALQARLEQLISELARVSAAREDAEDSAARLLAAATRESRR
jgi:hypothetical protein